MTMIQILIARLLMSAFGLWLAPTTNHTDPTLRAPTAVDVLPSADDAKSHLPDSEPKPQIAVWLSETDPEILFVTVRLDKPRHLHGAIGMDEVTLRSIGDKSELLFATAARHGAWKRATTNIWVTYVDDTGKRVPIGRKNLAGKPQPVVWRGPDAPAAPAAVKDLKGIVRDYDVPSESLGETRRVTVYLPPGYEPHKSSPAAVIYFGDGGAVESMAGVVEQLIFTQKIRPVVMVGAHNSDEIVRPKNLPVANPTTEPDPFASDARAMEYLEPEFNESQGNAETAAIHRFMFDRHFKFFADDLPKWAEQTLGVDSKRESRIISGFSNSAGFVVTLARARPMEFGAVIANSVAGSGPPAQADEAFKDLPQGATPPTFYFSDGTWERYFASNTLAWSRYVGAHGAESHRLKIVGGHEQAIWELGIASALPNLLPPDGK